MKLYDKIDLHMHTVISDGTDTPEELLPLVKEAGLDVFSVTDHDSVKGSQIIPPLLKEGDPVFISGVEFSCKDEEGKYHILGYAYDPEASSIRQLMEKGHTFRMNKLAGRMQRLTEEFGFVFPKKDLDELFAMDNPGKPHIGNLMVRLGFAESKDQAIREFIDKVNWKSEYLRPEEAIRGILDAGGVPVLAHPSYGSGDELILGEEMDERLKKLISFGIQGVEAYYSGFTQRLRLENLAFAEKYNLYVTAGSDYHGKNKIVVLGDTDLPAQEERAEGFKRFLARVLPEK